MKTRLLSLAAACALVFTMLPCTALGAEVPAQYTTSTGKTISVQKISDSAAEKLRGASYMGEGIFSHYENGAYHFMDENGNELGKVDDADIMMDSYFYNGRCKAYVFDPYTAKYAYGYLDKTGKIAIAAQYSDAYAFSNGLALVKKGDSFGYIDTAGNVVIPFQYYMATDFHDGYASVAYYLDGNEHQKHVEIINTKGETVWESPYATREIEQNMIAHDPYFSITYLTKVFDGKAVFWHTEQGVNTTCVLLGTDGSKQELPASMLEDSSVEYVGGDRFWVLKASRPGLYTTSGEILLPHQYFYYEVTRDDEAGLAVIGSMEDAFTIDYNGKVVIPAGEWDYKSKFNRGVALVTKGTDWDAPMYLLKVEDSGTTEPEPKPEPVVDEPSSWAAEQVNAAITAGIVPQSLQSKYTQTATRAEFCALAVELYETVKGSEIAERVSFTDTDDVNVEKMAALGVVSGVGNHKFNPNGALTREQAATMLARLANALGKPLAEQAPTFADNGSISSWAYDAVGQVQGAGIMDGTGNNMFAPQNSYTREQSILTAMRLFQLMCLTSYE